LKARKGLAQHFLVDETVLELVISAAEITDNDTIVEVGPGLGTLTGELADRAGRVIAIEIDSRLADFLRQNLASSTNITVVNDDVLNIKPGDLLRNLGVKTDSLSAYKVVANLPYYITAPVLRHFLEAEGKPQTMVVMVQKEVAEAIVAKPGQMSVLAVSVQFYGEPRIVGYVPAQSFYPRPEVDSAILKINVYQNPVFAVDNEPGFFALVRAGFTASRKQIVNSLAQGLDLPKPDVLSRLAAADIVPRRRAETLTVAEWVKLWRVHAGRGN
jgi:16S rRNA (adenine1518-N6/adenine1519-N6)-dimethyltransferase